MRALFLLFFFWTTLAPAPTIRILFRERPDMDKAAKMVGAKNYSSATPFQKMEISQLTDTTSLGHVAIEIPPGLIPGSNIMGWLPVPTDRLPIGHRFHGVSRDRVMLELMGGSNSYYPSLWGQFEDNSRWAWHGMGNPLDPTMEISLEVTNEQLLALTRELKAMNTRGEYQLIPDPWIGRERKYAEGKYNCVAAIDHLLKVAGISGGPDFPDNGSITKFVTDNRARATPYQSRLFCPFPAAAEPNQK